MLKMYEENKINRVDVYPVSKSSWFIKCQIWLMKKDVET